MTKTFHKCLAINDCKGPSNQIPGGGIFKRPGVLSVCLRGVKTGLTSITHGWPGPSLAVHLSAPSSAEPGRET